MRSQHRVWETIAHSFDRNRTRTWPHVEAFLRSLPPGTRVLDLMAGNGRHTRLAHDLGLQVAWLDWSRPAARISAARLPGTPHLVADATRLPLADASFGAAILVAGLHSLPDAAARAACLREARRVLQPGAPLQVTVWSRDAPRWRTHGTAGEPVDVVLPWRAHGHDEPRHYHLTTPGALRAELGTAGFTVAATSEAAIVSDEPDNLVAVALA